MQAATIEVLVHKGKFDPQIAVAIAEAIDMTIGNSQLLTAPIFQSEMGRIDKRFAQIDVSFAEIDGRFGELEAGLEAKLQRFKNEIILWIIAMTVGNAFLPKLAALVGQALGGGHMGVGP